MDIKGHILEAYFVKRINRFVAEIEVNGKIEISHVPNTGRMKELLVKGVKVLVRLVDDIKRKTKYDLLMVYHNNILVSIDSKLPNYLLYQGFKERDLKFWGNYDIVKKEVTYGNSRIDIGLIGKNGNTLIEAKCVTLVENGVAKFPDAPTKRGTKHINELIHANRKGINTGVIFVIQRQDANTFMPNWDMDKEFSQALVKAYNEGVIIKALVCSVKKDSISLTHEINVNFEV
ncbi:DNA/RNA nuclease SfsA [Dethiothermospora halolimnae]|uniref:DNA/RNA nuclease SfsA n=1 Tax=Dethiothermospora halolimnae TaxID=3114390 RepID=UPI003CCBC6EA